MESRISKRAAIAGWLILSACAGPPPPVLPRASADSKSDEMPPPAKPPSAPTTPDREPDVSQQPPPDPLWVANTASMTDADDTSGMPAGLLKDNIKTTAYTAVVRITEARVDDPHPGFGYVNHVYRAEVLEIFRGVSEKTIEYRVMAERDIQLSLPAYPIIVSLCGDDDKGFYVPDNGYTTPAAKSLIAVARRVGRSIKPRAPSPACETDE